MENPRPEKVAIVSEVREKLSESDAVILTEYRGLSVADMAKLRQQLGDAGAEYKIYKNTLVRLATRELGLEELETMLEGPTAVAFVKGDVAEVAKALRDFSKTNPALIMKGGVLGEAILSSADATKLANLEPRSVMLAKFAGLLAAPMQQFASLLQAAPRQMAGLLQALIDDRNANGDPNSSGGAPPSGGDAQSSVPVSESALSEADQSESDEPAAPETGAEATVAEDGGAQEATTEAASAEATGDSGDQASDEA